ncbi:hypothetical protein WK57_10320 [Burkholderia ubonensis]|uniref:TonB-dependent receptor plug domain-containing protein n=1 Tax=Burkholderia ubonensis TaxID=101571 RepID=A0AA40RCV2_9BURK|nr:hypothetical protein WK57_10320 [Burkholderia ubonensis]
MLTCAMTTSGALAAQAAAADAAPHALPTINVTARGAPLDPLSRVLDTGSRLGLSSLDTPASVETVTAEAIATRGDHTVLDAVTRATGFSGAAAPGNGGTALSVRIPRKPNAHSTLKRTPIPRLSEHAFHAQANAADVATRA